MRALSREEARAVDLRACAGLGIPTICLMENAGAGAARVAARMLGKPRAQIVVACGPGQNGGDGYVLARHMAIDGHALSIVQLPSGEAPDPPGDAGVNSGICRALGLPVHRWTTEPGRGLAISALATADLVVDALFGTGLARPVAGAASELVLGIGARGRLVLALDIPSGLDCDTGLPSGPCVRADATATFVAAKLGFENPASREWTGEVTVVPIGAPAEWPAAPPPRGS